MGNAQSTPLHNQLSKLGLHSNASHRLPTTHALCAGAAGANVGAAATELGSSKNPIYMMQAEPTFRAQLWRTVRTLAVAFLIISGIGALFDERGLGKGILHNPDMKPQLDSKTKFEDVKGVDEAKVSTDSSCICVSQAAGLPCGYDSTSMTYLLASGFEIWSSM